MSSKQGGAGMPPGRSGSRKGAPVPLPPPPPPSLVNSSLATTSNSSLANSNSLPSMASLPSLVPTAPGAPSAAPLYDRPPASTMLVTPAAMEEPPAAEEAGSSGPQLRPPSRAPSRGGTAASAARRAASPDFWSHHTAPQLLETSIRNPELKLQLLTRALEESRGKLQQLQRDRAAVSDALGQLCLASGATGKEAAAAARPANPEDDTLLPRRIDLLTAQLQALREAVQAGEAAVTDVQAQHERAALQVVVQQQHREALERQLEEARYTAQQHEQAQHALQVKVGLLEEQLAASADSARRRMEEQLDTFRGDAMTARTLRNKYVDMERQLDTAQRAQHADAEQCSRLAAQVERLQAQLKEATRGQAELGQHLLDKSAALSKLTDEHRSLQAEATALAAHNSQLQAALSASQQRAQQGENLGTGLQAQCQAAQQLQGALHEEAERLKAELQQERGQKHHLQTALAEERLVCASQRAALQGKGEEIASLCVKLDEYSGRIVAAEGALEASERRVEQQGVLLQQVEEASQQARHENSSLRDSLADLAASEARLKQQLEQAEARGAETEAARAALVLTGQEQDTAAARTREHVQTLQASLAEQARQLEQMAALQQQVEGQRQQVADLKGELHAAVVRGQASQAAVDELAAAKQQLERELHKQEILCRRFQEQWNEANVALQTTGKELKAARAGAEAASAQAAQEREDHAAAVEALKQQHAQRRSRNEHLERECRQQAIIIAELQATTISLTARLEATRQHNAALHRYAVAHGAAYGRLAGHSAGLHQLYARQLRWLLQLCRHLDLQVAAALAAADPVAALEADRCCSGGSSSLEAAQTPAALPVVHEAAVAGTHAAGSSAAAVAAAVLSIESLRTELQVSVQLLEQQGGSSEVQQLAAVPDGIAQGLDADLAGLPPSLLTSPRLGLDEGAAMAAAGPESATASNSSSSSSSSRSRLQQSLQPTPASKTSQAAQQQDRTTRIAATTPAKPPSSVLSAQVSQMEAHLQRLVRSGAEHAARAAAAVLLQEQERAARQRAQDLATELTTQLAATQADLDATREQRGQLEGQCQQLAQDLRDAIYSLGQVHAQHQGQAVSWAVRGLKSAGVQTQYCELWESNLGGTAGTCHNSAGAINGTACVAGSGSGNGSVLWAAAQESSSGSSRGGSGEASENGGEADASSGVEVQGQEEAAAARVLPLPALRQAIQDIYRAKAIADIAVARGQRPFLPLADFLAAYLAQQHGAEGAAVQQRAQQLQASVEAHAGVWEVGLFGLAAGMLEEAENWDAAPPGSAPAILVRPPGSSSPSAAAPPPSAAADAVPLVLYHSRRRRGTPSQLQHGEALSSLRRFCGASWLAAFRRSAALCPAGPDQLLHGMAAELHNLALSVPGMEQLAAWVLGGGVGACLPQLDLGLRLAENQVPQLYLLAVESSRLLGLATTPQLYVKSSGEAAAYYLLLPDTARLHGFNGSSADAASDRASSASAEKSSRDDGGERSSSSSAALRLLEAGSTVAGGSQVAAEPRDWQCALVLTSGLVDLLEPGELQAVMAGCLGFHAALTSPAGGSSLAPAASQEGAQLAALCRSMAALATLGTLSALSPDLLARRLPQQMAPFVFSRLRPVLARALRYLALYCDRVAAAATGGWRPVAASIVKQAAGCTVLRDELNLDAVIQQAQELDGATAELLPKALLREEGATVAGAAASLVLLRVRELQKWAAAERR